MCWIFGCGVALLGWVAHLLCCCSLARNRGLSLLQLYQKYHHRALPTREDGSDAFRNTSEAASNAGLTGNADIPQRRLRMKVSIGAGLVMGMHTGGVGSRWEYFIAGEPMAQVAAAEKVAEPGYVVLHQRAWQLVVRERMSPGIVATSLPGCPHFRVVQMSQPVLSSRPREHHTTAASVRKYINAVIRRRMQHLDKLARQPSIASFFREYLQRAVLDRVDSQQTEWDGELRKLTVLFIMLPGVTDASERLESVDATSRGGPMGSPTSLKVDGMTATPGRLRPAGAKAGNDSPTDSARRRFYNMGSTSAAMLNVGSMDLSRQQSLQMSLGPSSFLSPQLSSLNGSGGVGTASARPLPMPRSAASASGQPSSRPPTLREQQPVFSMRHLHEEGLAKRVTSPTSLGGDSLNPDRVVGGSVRQPPTCSSSSLSLSTSETKTPGTASRTDRRASRRNSGLGLITEGQELDHAEAGRLPSNAGSLHSRGGWNQLYARSTSVSRPRISRVVPADEMAAGIDSVMGRPDINVAGVQVSVFSAMKVLAKYEGIVRQFIVDDKGAVLIGAFGVAPFGHEDDERRGMMAAVEIHTVLKRCGTDCCIGVATGNVFCGNVGGKSRREYALVGDAVNTSARLMAYAYKNAKKYRAEEQLQKQQQAQEGGPSDASGSGTDVPTPAAGSGAAVDTASTPDPALGLAASLSDPTKQGQPPNTERAPSSDVVVEEAEVPATIEEAVSTVSLSVHEHEPSARGESFLRSHSNVGGPTSPLHLVRSQPFCARVYFFGRVVYSRSCLRLFVFLSSLVVVCV